MCFISQLSVAVIMVVAGSKTTQLMAGTWKKELKFLYFPLRLHLPNGWTPTSVYFLKFCDFSKALWTGDHTFNARALKYS